MRLPDDFKYPATALHCVPRGHPRWLVVRDSTHTAWICTANSAKELRKIGSEGLATVVSMDLGRKVVLSRVID